MNRRLTSLTEFFAPMTMAAVALLAVNDHVLKARFHNAVTGKLSDIALCFFLPLFVSALLGLAVRWSIERRLLVGSLATLVAFFLLEMSDRAAAEFTRVILAIGGPLGIHRVVLTRDPTDLFTMLLVPAAFAYGKYRARRAALVVVADAFREAVQ